MRRSIAVLGLASALCACGTREPARSPAAAPSRETTQRPHLAEPATPSAALPPSEARASASLERVQRDETLTLGSLTVHLRGRGEHALLLLHGYGAPGDDLVPLGEALAGQVPGLRVVLPEAPQRWQHGGEGRAWYERARADVPGQIADARAQLSELLTALEAREGIAASRVTFAGFSMGATMSIELTLGGDARPAALVALSGNALPAFGTDWDAMRGLPVFVSHGHADSILPFRNGEQIRDLSTRGGGAVTFVEFDGGHAIPPEVVAGLVTFLRDRQ